MLLPADAENVCFGEICSSVCSDAMFRAQKRVHEITFKRQGVGLQGQ